MLIIIIVTKILRLNKNEKFIVENYVIKRKKDYFGSVGSIFNISADLSKTMCFKMESYWSENCE